MDCRVAKEKVELAAFRSFFFRKNTQLWTLCPCVLDIAELPGK